LAKDLGRTFESRAKANLERVAAGVLGEKGDELESLSQQERSMEQVGC
jgi:hypothetical protein